MTIDNSTDKQPTTPTFSLAKIITIVLGLLTFVGVLLAQMGWGVAVAAESVFGIPHTSLFGSSFELLQLAILAVTNSFSGVSELLKHPIKYLNTAATHSTTSLSIAIAICLGAIATIGKVAGRARLNMTGRNRFISWFFRKPSIRHDSYSVLWARAGLFGVALWLFNFLIAPFITALIVLLFCFLVALVPALSIAAGEAHIRTYVVEPKACSPVRDRTTILQYWDKKTSKPAGKPVPAAMCVSILEREKVLFSGRVVWATSQSVLLFDPVTGEARRMSINGRDIKVIEELPAQPDEGTEIPEASGAQPGDRPSL